MSRRCRPIPHRRRQGDCDGQRHRAGCRCRGRPDTPSAGAAYVAAITARAQAENRAFEAQARARSAADDDVSAELEDKMNRHRVKDIFRAEALAMRLPQFFMRVQNGGFFEADEPFQLFEREELLKEFRLSQGDATISFEDVEADVYRVDLEQLGDENYAPRAFKLAARDRAKVTQLPPRPAAR